MASSLVQEALASATPAAQSGVATTIAEVTITTVTIIVATRGATADYVSGIGYLELLESN